MTENTIDLKKLVLLIDANKEIKANFNLDEGCVFDADDPKPLVKVINYFINYLEPLTTLPLEISVELRSDKYVMNFLAYTDKKDLPALSDKLNEALAAYKASYEKVHQSGKYFQIKISFAR